jgi:hypothetical protein
MQTILDTRNELIAQDTQFNTLLGKISKNKDKLNQVIEASRLLEEADIRLEFTHKCNSLRTLGVSATLVSEGNAISFVVECVDDNFEEYKVSYELCDELSIADACRGFALFLSDIQQISDEFINCCTLAAIESLNVIKH